MTTNEAMMEILQSLKCIEALLKKVLDRENAGPTTPTTPTTTFVYPEVPVFANCEGCNQVATVLKRRGIPTCCACWDKPVSAGGGELPLLGAKERSSLNKNARVIPGGIYCHGRDVPLA